MKMMRSAISTLVQFAVLLASPLVLDRYWLDVLNRSGFTRCSALSLNIILGQVGMFHMGQAAFYAIGAYTTAISTPAATSPCSGSCP